MKKWILEFDIDAKKRFSQPRWFSETASSKGNKKKYSKILFPITKVDMGSL